MPGGLVTSLCSQPPISGGSRHILKLKALGQDLLGRAPQSEDSK